MKRKEMIKKLENNFNNIFAKVGYDGDLYIYYKTIFEESFVICHIDENKQYEFLLYNEYHFMLDNDEEQKELFDIIVEYSKTPIEEREEEPRYQYYIPSVQGLEVSSGQRDSLFLNYDTGTGKWVFSTNNNGCGFQTIFTYKELEKYGIDPQELREKYKEIKVEW